MVPYDFNDVVKALNAVMPYDWRDFWTQRLNRVRSDAPLEGLTASGWHLTFTAEPTAVEKGESALKKNTDLSYSLGFLLKDEGAVISTVVPGTPADAAGIAPDSNLIAVDDRKYSKDVLDRCAQGRRHRAARHPFVDSRKTRRSRRSSCFMQVMNAIRTSSAMRPSPIC